uniref:Serpin domain-containing protein n=1 Tax=Lepisosteus oculatus TaxID=7918 RepID=W5MH36_LEPOC|nr:PREDICTED: pigment epithelium-derived factor [Lepisosteus oculatus]
MQKITLLMCLGALLSLSSAQLEPDPNAETEGAAEEETELFTTPTTKLAAATANFGYSLFREQVNRDPQASVFLSPLSVSAALTQLSLGGSAEAERKLYRVLQYHHLQDSQLHSTLKNLLASVTSPSKGFSSASRVYLERKLRLKLEYLNSVEREYGVRPKALTGSPRGDLKEVNDWVKQQTGGKVNSFLTSSLPRNMGVLPLGAAYFKGQWVTRFGQSNQMESFQVEGSAPARVPMMKEDRYPVKLGIDSDLRCKIAQVQMQGDVSMLIFLPDDVTQNMTLIEESLSAEFVQDTVSALQPVELSLALPALRFSYSADLLPLLSDMGLKEWLAKTDLVKITSQPAKVGSVRHKLGVEMTPEGGQSVARAPHPEGQALGLSFQVNRPFLFLVRDEPSGALLFIGKVLDPQKLGRI